MQLRWYVRNGISTHLILGHPYVDDRPAELSR